MSPSRTRSAPFHPRPSTRLALAESHDPGFDEAVFVIALRAIHRLPLAEFTPYGLTACDVSARTARMTHWADTIES